MHSNHLLSCQPTKPSNNSYMVMCSNNLVHIFVSIASHVGVSDQQPHELPIAHILLISICAICKHMIISIESKKLEIVVTT